MKLRDCVVCGEPIAPPYRLCNRCLAEESGLRFATKAPDMTREEVIAYLRAKQAETVYAEQIVRRLERIEGVIGRPWIVRTIASWFGG